MDIDKATNQAMTDLSNYAEPKQEAEDNAKKKNSISQGVEAIIDDLKQVKLQEEEQARQKKLEEEVGKPKTSTTENNSASSRFGNVEIHFVE